MESSRDISPGHKDADEEFVINPQTGMIVSHGHEYANTPRMRHLVRRANEIRNSLPPIKSGHIRLWRGNRPGEEGQNPSYTNSLEGIALPFLGGYGGSLSYIDVPETDLRTYKEGGLPGSEFLLPAEVVKNAIVVTS